MKKLSLIFTGLAAVAALTLASCSDEDKFSSVMPDEDLPEVLPDGRVEARFGAPEGSGLEVLEDMMRSSSTWNPSVFESHLGIIAYTEDGSEIYDGYENEEYRAFYSGSSVRFDAWNDGIYYSADPEERIKFSAYYPYQETLENGNIFKVDLTQNYDDTDMLLWTGMTEDSYNKESGVVQMNMLRQYAIVRIILNEGDGYDADDIKDATITISEMALKADFDVHTGQVTNVTETGTQNFSFLGVSAGYYIYALPTEASATRTVIIRLASGAEYEWVIADKTFEAGHFYEFNLRVNKVESQFNITVEDQIIDKEGSVSYPNYVDLGK